MIERSSWFRRGRRIVHAVPAVLAAAAVTMAWIAAARSQEAPRAPLRVHTAKACAALVGEDLSPIGGAGSRIVRATEEAGADTIAVCAIEATLAPEIRVQLRLPVLTWQGRYLQIGCGGLCGQINLSVGAADGCVPLQTGGFAVAATDMGHQGPGGDFGKDRQRREDFAFRAQHVTALAAKQIIAAFYGRAPAYSYFTGCSDGGREALVEAQRFPEDFDGIIAGAAALNFQVQNSLHHGWLARSNMGADGKAILTAPRLPILHKAVLDACDALDGQSDRLIADPRRCSFNPRTIVCAAGQDAGTCLTAVEAEAARRFYAGPRDAATGTRLTLGGPQFGSELAWAGVFVPQTAEQPIFSERIALDALGQLIFDTAPPADFTLKDLSFDLATFGRLRPRHPLFDATNPDLGRFADRGGKLILWHGWADPHISPLNTIAYHEAVQAQMGAATAERFTRLYLLPGVYHCSGGEGPSQLDLLTPMLRWVEQGLAPEAIETRQAPPRRVGNGFGQPGGMAPPNGTGPGLGPKRGPGPITTAEAGSFVARARPVYPYPAEAALRAGADPDVAASYQPVTKPDQPVRPDWAGTDFFRPY